MAVTYQTEGIKMPEIKKRETTEWIKAVAASYGKRLGEIAYIFCSDEKILEVNRQYLQHDYYRLWSLSPSNRQAYQIHNRRLHQSCRSCEGLYHHCGVQCKTAGWGCQSTQRARHHHRWNRFL